jgi:hypothetical protein
VIVTSCLVAVDYVGHGIVPAEELPDVVGDSIQWRLRISNEAAEPPFLGVSPGT